VLTRPVLHPIIVLDVDSQRVSDCEHNAEPGATQVDLRSLIVLVKFSVDDAGGRLLAKLELDFINVRRSNDELLLVLALVSLSQRDFKQKLVLESLPCSASFLFHLSDLLFKRVKVA